MKIKDKIGQNNLYQNYAETVFLKHWLSAKAICTPQQHSTGMCEDIFSCHKLEKGTGYY